MKPGDPDHDALAARLTGVGGLGPIPTDRLVPTNFAGLSHTHWRIQGSGRVLRILTGAQPGSDTGAALRYEAACFERAWPAGVTPRKFGVLPPGPGAPFGGLVVEEITGRIPRLPDDLPAIAQSLARLHALRKPAANARAPLAEHADPVRDIVAMAASRRGLLRRCGAPRESIEMIEAEIAEAERFAAAVSGTAHPARFALMDAHPGNFMIDGAGRAVAVDLEKALYSSPAADLAHASLGPTVTWDRRIQGALGEGDVAAFYQSYLDALTDLGAPRLAGAARTWFAPMRRLVWLRVVTWFAEWTLRVGDAHLSDRLRLIAPHAFNAAVEAAQAALKPQAVAEARREWTAAAL